MDLQRPIAFSLLMLIPLFGLCDADYDRCVDQYLAGTEASIEVFEEIASAGDANSQYCVGVAYHEGKGVDRDPATAIEWYLKAGQKGHLEAQYWLCLMYREGMGVTPNALESLYWCKRAAKEKHPSALYALGQWYYDGHGRNKFTDHINAYIWFSRAAAAGEDAGADMIRMLENQMTDLQIIEARKLAESR